MIMFQIMFFPVISVAVLDDVYSTQTELRLFSMLQLELGPEQKLDSETGVDSKWLVKANVSITQVVSMSQTTLM